MIVWEPHLPRARVRVSETSCCAAYEWACDGGQFLVLRLAEGGYEEAGRGRYRQARELWEQLVAEHARVHLSTAPRWWSH